MNKDLLNIISPKDSDYSQDKKICIFIQSKVTRRQRTLAAFFLQLRTLFPFILTSFKLTFQLSKEQLEFTIEICTVPRRVKRQTTSTVYARDTFKASRLATAQFKLNTRMLYGSKETFSFVSVLGLWLNIISFVLFKHKNSTVNPRKICKWDFCSANEGFDSDESLIPSDHQLQYQNDSGSLCSSFTLLFIIITLRKYLLSEPTAVMNLHTCCLCCRAMYETIQLTCYYQKLHCSCKRRRDELAKLDLLPFYNCV